MFNYLSYKIEANIKFTFILLLFFHTLFATFIFFIANSEYLSNFHNGNGIWHFAADTHQYHSEALHSLQFLQNSQWLNWWNAYSTHVQVKFVSLSYWITGFDKQLAFEVVNGLVWTSSLMLVYRSSQVLFRNNTVAPILTALFFFQPSVLFSSTQLLKDPFILLGVCFLCHGWILIAKTKFHARAVIYIVLGSLLYISVRPYLSIAVMSIFSIYLVYLLIKNEITVFIAAITILSLLLIFIANMDGSFKRGATLIKPTNTEFNDVIGFPNTSVQKEGNTYRDARKTISNWEINSFIAPMASLRADSKFQDSDDLIEHFMVALGGVIKSYDNSNKRDGSKGLTMVEILSLRSILNKLKNIRINLLAGALMSEKSPEIVDKVLSRAIEGKGITGLESGNDMGVNLFPAHDEVPKSLYTRIIETEETLLTSLNQLLKMREEWNDRNVLIKFLDVTSYRLLELRNSFLYNYSASKSVIDANVQYDGFVGAINYLPRALQVSFLSPFPTHWLEEGSQATGRIGRLLSGLEMLVWYVVIIGFFYVVINEPITIKPLIPILILSTLVIILVGYVIPNVGAIFRMRLNQIIPFYLLGIYGVYSITYRLTNKRSVNL